MFSPLTFNQVKCKTMKSMHRMSRCGGCRWKGVKLNKEKNHARPAAKCVETRTQRGVCRVVLERALHRKKSRKMIREFV